MYWEEVPALLDRLAAVWPGYTPREGQRTMARAVAHTVDTGRSLLVEGGTGVGKSIAYLLPAALSALEDDKRTLIATSHKQLQDQLSTQDLPRINALLQDLGYPGIVWTTLKGLGSYVCRAAVEAEAALPAPAPELPALRAWLASGGHHGEFEELPFALPPALRARLSTEPVECPHTACPHFFECFGMAARMRAAQAPIVILNHALLAVHASLPNGLRIGDFDSVVIDEAHAFEDAATQAFGFSAAGAAIHHFLDRAPVRFRTDQRHWEDAAAALGRLDQDVAARLGPEATRLDHPLLAGLDLADALDALARDLDPEHRQPGREYAYDQSPFALPDEVLRAAGVEETALERLARQGADLADRLRTIAAVDDPLLVYHVEPGGSDADPPGYTLLALPLDVAPYLSGWWEAQASILTSATLSDGHSFSFVRERLGLSDARPHELVVPSPFDYADRTRLVLTPVPGQDRADAVYFDALAMQMARLLDSAGGKALLLFTSHRALDAVWKRLQVLRLGGWRLVRQGELSPARVRDLFAGAAPDARIAVFASRSWWQGVDLPGMRLVVMDKLPFPQLGDPMVAARSAAVEQQEGHVFLQYLLPLALIAFRQGFGRLMRGEADFGAVAVCDARLGTRSYGARFLAALPDDIPVLHSSDALRAWVRTMAPPDPDEGG